MIVDLVLGVITSIVNLLSSALPTFTWPSWLSSGWLTGVEFEHLGFALHPMANVVGLTFLVTVLRAFSVLMPVAFGFYAFEWVWRHIPTIAGFGTH